MRQCIVGPIRVDLQVVEDFAVMAMRTKLVIESPWASASCCAQALVLNSPPMLVSRSLFWQSWWIWRYRRKSGIRLSAPVERVTGDVLEANTSSSTEFRVNMHARIHPNEKVGKLTVAIQYQTIRCCCQASFGFPHASLCWLFSDIFLVFPLIARV